MKSHKDRLLQDVKDAAERLEDEAYAIKKHVTKTKIPNAELDSMKTTVSNHYHSLLRALESFSTSIDR